jgi:flagellar M-ring protein FliF
VIDAEMLSRQVDLAQKLVADKPESAVAALRQMLGTPEPEPAA